MGLVINSKGRITMTEEPANKETFESYKNSYFQTGSRRNLNFKFMAHLSETDADLFFQGLFKLLGEAYDSNNYDSVTDYVIEWQIKGYAHQKGFGYDEGPFMKPAKPLSELSVALISSSGHFVEGDDPEPLGVQDMTQHQAEERILEFLKEEPRLSKIPIDTPPEKIRVRHGGYDISGSALDYNVSMPIKQLAELEQNKVIGKFVSPIFSFVGACSQKRLLTKTGPRWVEMFKDHKIDAALLVPV
jgi:hypothetical protein